MQNTLITLAEQVVQHLKTLNLQLVTAESCTGGGVAYYLTMIPGSSAILERGWVTYSNTAKIQLLQVDEKTLAQYGAVSAETAHAMAEGALKNSAAQISIAITGIAGPEGGSHDKPVGTVWFALAQNTKIRTEIQYFSGSRFEIREQAISFAFNLILTALKHYN